MTDYKEEADKIIESVRESIGINKDSLKHEPFWQHKIINLSTLSQQRVVDELEYLKIKSTACNASDIFAGRLEYHQNILKELQSRL